MRTMPLGMGDKDIMDHFHFVDVKPKIDRNEVSLIKETIFKRAREKAERMNQEQNNQYTSDIKNDVMEIASADFRSSEFNPFNKFKESLGLNQKEQVPVEQEEPANEVKSADNSLEKTFEMKPLHNIQSVSVSNYANSVKDETMDIARTRFRQERNLTTSLNFLNAQAAIQMAKYAHSKINYLS